MIAYCVRCRCHQEISQPTIVRTRHGELSMVGSCRICSAQIYAPASTHQLAVRPVDNRLCTGDSALSAAAGTRL